LCLKSGLSILPKVDLESCKTDLDKLVRLKTCVVTIELTSHSAIIIMSSEYYLFHTLPRAIIRDFIFREMLDLEDIARLEVAAAVHLLQTRTRYLNYDDTTCAVQ
jgi:hypothetical protein